jgi:hypothetical protein
MSEVSISFNDAEFTRALRDYAARSQKALPRVINQKLFYIAANAAKLTPRVTREQIEQELGVKGYRLEFGKRGKILASSKKRKSINAITDATSLIHLIINRRLGKSGKKGLYGTAMRTAVAQFLKKRFQSVGTLKAGWTAAIRRLGAAIGATFQNAGASASVRGKSSATVAREGWNPTASLTYNTNSFDQDHRPYLDARLMKALRAAFEAEKKLMTRDIAKALDPKPMSQAAAMAEVQRVMRGGV